MNENISQPDTTLGDLSKPHKFELFFVSKMSFIPPKNGAVVQAIFVHLIFLPTLFVIWVLVKTDVTCIFWFFYFLSA